jgi:hypothetical protein
MPRRAVRIENIRRICEEQLKNRCLLEIIGEEKRSCNRQALLTTKGVVTIFFENKTHKIKEVRGIKQYLLSLLLG